MKGVNHGKQIRKAISCIIIGCYYILHCLHNIYAYFQGVKEGIQDGGWEKLPYTPEEYNELVKCDWSKLLPKEGIRAKT